MFRLTTTTNVESTMNKFLTFVLVLISLSAHAKLEWQYQSKGQISGKPIIYLNKIYFTSDDSLRVLNKNGQLKWQYDLGAKSKSEVAIDDTGIYVLADNGLHALSHSGVKLWHFKTQDSDWEINGLTWGWGSNKVKDIWAWYRSAPIIKDNSLFFGNSKGTFAIDKQNGELLWQADTGVVHTKPALADNILVVGSWNNHLYGLNVETGDILWTFKGRVPSKEWDGWNGFNLSPVILKSTIYVGSRGSYFYAIDVTSGKERWSSQYANTWIGSPAVQHQGKLYFGTSDGYSLIGLDASGGSQSLLYLNDFYNFAQPQVWQNSVYFGSVSGQIHKVNIKDMQGESVFSTPESVKNYRDVVKESGGLKVLFATGDKYNYLNSQKDVERMLNKLGSILSITINDGVLYAGTSNGTLYALTL